ncbi:MAG: ribonuclease D [Alphaproteobacteria bacterium]|nr:ribonuclease D [Alphaproteobacteria bacterium]MCL2504637.1 ribonuclease D [Alphaproteobacteria bacterium]
MTITLHKNDLPDNIHFEGCVAVDTESMGLNWDRDRLCLVQLSGGDGNAHLVQFVDKDYSAPNLKKLLTDPETLKLFHFARADLCAIYKYLGVLPNPVYCTKIASVIARTFSDKHSLKDLAKDILHIDLSKEQQTSDWGAEELSGEQLAYAAADVLYLHKIKDALNARLIRENRYDLAIKAMSCLPIRAELDLAGWENVDVFSHAPIKNT